MIPRDHNEIANLCREAILEHWDTPIYEFSDNFQGVIQTDEGIKALFKDWVDAYKIRPNEFSG